MKKSILFSSILVASLAIAGIGFLASLRRGEPRPPQATHGETARIQLTRESIGALQWQDLATGRFVVENPSDQQLSQLLDWTEQTTNPPTIYFRGLLLLIDGRSEEALESFDTVPLDAIPAEQLYAPYRLHDAQRPAQPNAYFSRLLSSLEQGRLTPLLAARVLARANQFEKSLGAYLATDPGTWTRHDASCLQRISIHSGLESEVRRLVMGAIGGGRIPSANEDAFLQLGFQDVRRRPIEGLRQQLRDRLEQDPRVSSVVVSSLKKMGKDRELFLNKQYRDLLDLHQDSNPVQVTSELALMLFLSALSEGERELSKLWGQELKRRHPHPETLQWVHDLTASKFDGA